MTFRPYPVLTLFSLVILVLLLWLGQWQWTRAGWKADLIENFQTLSSKPPISLEEALCDASLAPTGTAISIADTEMASPERLRLFGASTDGRPGWRLFEAVPAVSCYAGAILVETGFEAYDGHIEEISSFRLEAFKSQKSQFSNANTPEKNEWYWFDHQEMENALFTTNLNVLNPDYILLPNNGLPQYLIQTPPSKHIGYSMTWYGMAIALIVLYAAYHHKAGRLQLGRRTKS